MEFWLVAIGLTGAVTISLIVALLRERPVGDDQTADQADMEVYRDQLAEIERDMARGVLNAEEGERTRVEVARRALEADRAAQAAGRTQRLSRPVALGLSALVVAVLLGGTGAVYLQLGAPGYADLPLEARKAAAAEQRRSRLDQAAAEALIPTAPLNMPDDPDLAALIDELRGIVEQRPDDLRGLQLLAGYEAQLGNHKAAYTALGKLILARGDAASVNEFLALAELMVQAAGGYVSPEAEDALEQVFLRDPNNGAARYYLGLLHAQNDRPDLAFRIWRILLNESRPDAPWTGFLMAQLPELAQAAGTRFNPPAALATGPDADDVAAAAEMAPEDRAAMIRGMVDGLASELASQGGPAEKWAQLIRSLGVLGDTDRARAIYDEALGVFAGRDADIAALTAAAQAAGIAP